MLVALAAIRGKIEKKNGLLFEWCPWRHAVSITSYASCGLVPSHLLWVDHIHHAQHNDREACLSISTSYEGAKNACRKHPTMRCRSVSTSSLKYMLIHVSVMSSSKTPRCFAVPSYEHLSKPIWFVMAISSFLRTYIITKTKTHHCCYSQARFQDPKTEAAKAWIGILKNFITALKSFLFIRLERMKWLNCGHICDLCLIDLV